MSLLFVILASFMAGYFLTYLALSIVSAVVVLIAAYFYWMMRGQGLGELMGYMAVICGVLFLVIGWGTALTVNNGWGNWSWLHKFIR